MHWPVIGTHALPVSSPTESLNPILNRVREVREQQGMSLRTASRRMEADVRLLRELEDPRTDLRLSDLYRWQKVLEVPIADLLVESQEPLSRPVLERARLLKLMKTAQAMLEKSPTAEIRHMAQMFIEQLCEIMPELKDVGPWPAVGQRRTIDDIGRIMENVVKMRDAVSDSE